MASSTASDLGEVVNVLNAPPFSKNVTLVSLHEQSPTELLQLLNDVFADLDKSHKVRGLAGSLSVCVVTVLAEHPLSKWGKFHS